MSTPLAGHSDARFAAVRDAFAANFSEHGEVGAACAVYVEGRLVVDLWGGYQDLGRACPWERDTLVNYYSVGKPFAALCALQLVESGELELDAPVARSWPEFAAAGKERVTVRELLCHRAGLPAIRELLAEDALYEWRAMTRALARTRPWFEPGTRHVYHTNTYGFLAGELVRRLTGERLGHHLRGRIAGPLGADVACGLSTPDLARCADVDWRGGGSAPDLSDLDALPEERRMLLLGYFNPPGASGLGVVNSERWRRAEVPSTNGHGTARGVARVYAALAAGGALDGVRLLPPALLAEAVRVQSEGWCPALEREVSFGLGFQPTRPDRPLGPSPGSFGHFGTGGSLGFADPDARLGFGYVMNRVIPRWQSPCNRGLIAALYACL